MLYGCGLQQIYFLTSEGPGGRRRHAQVTCGGFLLGFLVRRVVVQWHNGPKEIFYVNN
jgi:hypothetical protein